MTPVVTASMIWTSSTRCVTPSVLNQGHRDLYIGADRAGRLLEVVVLDDGGQLVAIHAMTLRPKFYEHL
ncbi:MAG: hypothetical protein ACRD0I_03580 [Acidimicrobiales bacterium]